MYRSFTSKKIKAALCCLFLLGSLTAWCIHETRLMDTLLESTWRRSTAVADVPWNLFPVVVGDSVQSSAGAHLVFVYRAYDCDALMQEMKQWNALADQYESVTLTGVFMTPYKTMATRYLKAYPRPFPVVHDSSRWFQEHFNLEQTPVLIASAEHSGIQKIQPGVQMQLDVDRRALLDRLASK